MDLKIKNDFESIYKEYAPQVYRYLLKIGCPPQDAEDITHDTFVKALLHIEQYRGEGKLSIWLCQIAKNTWFNNLRKNKKETPTSPAVSIPTEKKGDETKVPPVKNEEKAK